MTVVFVPTVPVLDKSGMQGSNMLEWMTSSPHMATACQVGLVSALHRVRSRLRGRPQLQSPMPVMPMKFTHRFMRWAAQRLPHQVSERVLQMPHMSVVTVLMVFAGLCCASWGARLTGVSKRRWQLKSARVSLVVPDGLTDPFDSPKEDDVQFELWVETRTDAAWCLLGDAGGANQGGAGNAATTTLRHTWDEFELLDTPCKRVSNSI